MMRLDHWSKPAVAVRRGGSTLGMIADEESTSQADVGSGGLLVDPFRPARGY